MCVALTYINTLNNAVCSETLQKDFSNPPLKHISISIILKESVVITDLNHINYQPEEQRKSTDEEE